ncbi:MAG: peptidylprolyl isomerase [Bryobacterales bacterium]|nr:peptidylprolyl isomerase [Bryobacterales bacterium]
MRFPFLVSIATSVCAMALMAQAPASAPKPAAAAKPKPAAAKPAVAAKPAAKKSAAPKAAAAKPAAAKAKPSAAALAAAGLDPVIATSGDVKITKSQFEDFVAGLPDYLKSMGIGPARKGLAQQMLDVMQVAAEARTLRYNQDPKIAAQLAFQAEQALANSFLNAEMQKALADEANIREFYERNKSIYKQVHARHILIRLPGSVVPLREGQKEKTEEEVLAHVQELRKRLVAGEDFEAIAKAESDDVGSGSRGGDLGFFSAGQMVAPFEAAAFALKEKEISEPVRTQFGFHIIQMLEIKERAFDEVKAEIKEKSGTELRTKFMQEIRRKYPVTMNEEYFAK